MTNFRKVFCILLSVCFFCALALLPEPYFLRGDVFRQLPLYSFLKEEALTASARVDTEMDKLLMENNAAYLGQKIQRENQAAPTGAVQEETAAQTGKVQEEPAAPTGKVQEEPAAPTGTVQEEQEAPTNVPEATPQAQTPEAAAAPEEEAVREAAVPALPAAQPVIDLSLERMADPDYVLQEFFIVDEQTRPSEEQLDGAGFLKKDFSLPEGGEGPQIVIYHSHSQETFADSREGERADSIVGVGDYLEELLTETYGYEVLHVTEKFDLINGELDRDGAYDVARPYMEELLKKNPSAEVVIDLHRDGVAKNRRLVTEINGKPTAQIMFFNGLSYTLEKGALSYLPNPYLMDNLAFSFQLEYQAALYYPELFRGIYLAGYRYNLHLKPRAILLEAGAQTNTVQEVKNAMEPFAQLLDNVLRGGAGENTS